MGQASLVQSSHGVKRGAPTHASRNVPQDIQTHIAIVVRHDIAHARIAWRHGSTVTDNESVNGFRWTIGAQ